MNLGYVTTHTGKTSCGCANNSGGSVCDPRKVKSISRVGDNAIIAFEDCTYIAAPMEVVDVSISNPTLVGVPQDLINTINTLKEQVAQVDTMTPEQVNALIAEALTNYVVTAPTLGSTYELPVHVRNNANE